MMAKTDYATDNLNERLTLDETGILIRDVLAVDVDYDSLLSEYAPMVDKEKELSRPVCGVGFDNLCLAGNGSYYPCSGWQGLPVGSAFSQRLADVWHHSPELARLRGITKASFPQCIECPDTQFCAMCLVRNFNESGGDMFRINRHFCEVAHLNRLLVEEHKNNLLASKA